MCWWQVEKVIQSSMELFNIKDETYGGERNLSLIHILFYLQYHTVPVSYTHLDVYKRQLLTNENSEE